MYILWNYDLDEPIAVSEDKGLLQEISCYCFMEDAYMDYCYNCVLGNGTIQDSWNATLDWYNMYIDIVEAPFYK